MTRRDVILIAGGSALLAEHVKRSLAFSITGGGALDILEVTTAPVWKGATPPPAPPWRNHQPYLKRKKGRS